MSETFKELKELDHADLLAAISRGRKFECLKTVVGVHWKEDVLPDVEKGAPHLLHQADAAVHMGTVLMMSPIAGETFPLNSFALIRWLDHASAA